MSTSPKVLLGEDGILSHRNTSSVDANLPNDREPHLEHEEEDEEDIDFNPFLKDSPSIEASSSLSSELDAWGGDVADSRGETAVAKTTDSSSLPPGQLQDYALGDSEHGEGIVVQTTISSGQIGVKESADTYSTRYMKRKAGYEPETEKDGEERVSTNNTAMNEVMVRDVVNPENAEDDDAICKRTRARYSLASFTLDELETFLQETDDDNDIQNVDDEEEYRKFLAAVLLDGVNDDQITHGVENVDDEDEDNDADFEIEIEEALESDPDESIKGKSKVDEEVGNRRPETRLNRRQKASSRQKNKLSSQTNRPLRPLLPNAPKASFPVSMPEASRVPGHDGFVNGFAQHQLGQLHSIIHEHVQLLIQVFSLCIVDPSKQHIASQVQEMISQLLCQRDQSLLWKVAPYPYCGASSPYIHPSAQRRLNEQGDCLSAANKEMQPDQTSSLENRGLASNGHDGGLQASNRASVIPSGSGPILSVLDVTPLRLVGKYMEDVSIALREYQRQRLEASCDTSSKKEPLFPFHSSSSEADFAVSKGTLVGDQSQKKTLAATLVERSKQQSIALVPKGIAELAQRFFPLFNPALFPRKPPPTPVANRILFTDAEDALLAMGLMEYNTDWKAIQQRFLPCKSEHQIFVRQKNRTSSKAPENPIKAVRRMKSSPLTAEEIGRIQEGLKVFKLEWMSIWRFIVPYRDPALLPRQWRIATGTQKSYKGSEDKKEKRRLYELKRRKCRASDSRCWQTLSEREEGLTDTVGENNSGDDGVDSEDEAYVHEAFLADWRPGDLMVQGGSRVMDQANSSASLVPQQRTNYEIPVAFKHSQNLATSSQSTHRSPGERNYVHDQVLTGPKYQLSSRSRRSRKGKNVQLVKLAPDLAPVNLPRSVRVMSQSAFKSYQGSTPTKRDGDMRGSAKESTVSSLPHVANSGNYHQTSNSVDKSNGTQHRQESPPGGDKSFAGDKDDSRDLHMHPLLFQSSGDGHLPYYPLNCGNSASSSINFLPQIQPQLNLSLLHNPQTTNHPVHWFQRSSQETTSTPGSIDFHPLLQKSGEVNCDSTTGQPASRLAVNSNSASNKSVLQPFVTVESESQPENRLSGPPSNSVCPNELDLDIRLSFTSGKEYGMRSTGTIGERSPGLSVPPDRIGDKFNSVSHEPVVSTNKIITSVVSIEDDQSFPEIVMEQEELSDSEEEFGEDVQFECEEMDDSEADEGYDSELQIMNKQNKDVPNAERGKARNEDAQARTKGGPPDGAGHAAECNASRLSLASEERAKENTINTSSLHDRLEETDREHAVTGSSVGVSNKSRKKQQPRRKRATPKQQENGPQPGSGAAKPSRRTRKSVGESNSSVNTGRTRKRNSSLSTGTTVENPKDVSNVGVS